MAGPAPSLFAGAFFPALLDFASSIVDSPLIRTILDIFRQAFPYVYMALFVYVAYRMFRCSVDYYSYSWPRFNDLQAGRRTPRLLGRGRGGPARPRHCPQPKSEALMRIHVYRRDGGEGGSAECVVCLEDFEDGEACLRLTCCKQTYHRACVNRWLLDRRRCPICRATVRVALGV